jgi:O-acetyl-ADP-ribose deacetylase
VRSIAFPAISCGAYDYPIPAAALIAVTTVRAVISAGGCPSIEQVWFCAFTGDVWAAYETALAPVADE